MMDTYEYWFTMVTWQKATITNVLPPNNSDR